MPPRRHFRPLVLTWIPLPLLGSCIADPEPLDLSTATPVARGILQRPQPMGPPADDPSDWLLLTSGEWLKGQILRLRDAIVEFDSAELDQLNIDWSDVEELHSPRVHTLALTDRKMHIGKIKVADGKLYLDAAQPRALDRDRLLAIVPGDGQEVANRWSGDVSFGTTVRSGNTDQIDTNSRIFMRRETASTRWESFYNTNVSIVDDQEIANQHRVQSRFDTFLTRRLFVTPIAAIYLRDPFQNLRARITPFTAIGYDIIDAAAFDWRFTGGPAYVITEYDSVPVGQDRRDSTAAMFLGSRIELDVTSYVDLEFEYQLTTPLPETDEYVHYLMAKLDFDLVGGVDLDLRLIWDRTNKPVADASGVAAEADDFRFVVGASFDF